MFEGSLMESRGLTVSRTERWSAAGSAALQLMAAALLVIIPMMRPQTMNIFTAVPHLTAPPPPMRPPAPARIVTNNQTSATPTVPATPQMAGGTPHFSPTPGTPAGEDQPIGPITNIVMGGGPSGLPSLEAESRPAISVVHAAAHGPVKISDLQPGMLLAPIRPVYPQIARITRTEGTVVVEAIISKTGKIESERAISGPALLQQAALDAVRKARYRPYLLSGDPVEVQTTITVIFRLGG